MTSGTSHGIVSSVSVAGFLLFVLFPSAGWTAEAETSEALQQFSFGVALSEGMLPCMSGIYRTNVRWEFLATAEFDGGRWDFVRAGTGLEDPFAISIGSAYVFDIGPVYFLLGAQLLGARGTTLGGPVAGFGLHIEVGPGWWLDFGVSGAVYPTHALARPLFPIEASVGTRHDLWRE